MSKALTLPSRPDWRDPNMPVLRNYLMSDGSRRTVIDPDYEHRYRAHLLSTTSNTLHWSADPTYHLRRDRLRSKSNV